MLVQRPITTPSFEIVGEEIIRSTTCDFCKKELAIQTGSVIFGAKWFHEECWQKNHDLLR